MEFKYWKNFTKRRNSTLQPDMSAAYSATITLKDWTGILNPTVILKGFSAAGITYAYIPDFGRYYFVDNVTYSFPELEVALILDPLATYKTDIGTYAGLMLRTGDVTFANVLLPDPMNQPTDEVTHRMQSTSLDTFTLGTGTYMLTVMSQPPSSGAAGNNNGLARTYALSQAEMAQVALEMLDPTFMQTLINEFANPMDSIISCFWLPIDKSKISTTTEPLKIGTQQIFAGASFVTSRLLTKSGTLATSGAFPNPGSNNYLYHAPYATYSIFLPFVGLVAIDDKVVFENAMIGLQYDMSIDVYTGDILYKIKNTAGSAVATYSGNCATQIPVAHASMASATGVVGGLVSVIGGGALVGASIATGGIAGVSIAGLAAMGGGAMATLKSTEIHTQINGSNSSAVGMQAGIYLEFHSWISTPAHTFGEVAHRCGYMCCKAGNAAAHPGYTQFANPCIDLSALDKEREEIDTVMASGFYYE